MKKIISLLVLFVFILVGCGNEKYKSVKCVEDFDELIGEAGVLKYDIRSEEECEKGHIPSFRFSRIYIV